MPLRVARALAVGFALAWLAAAAPAQERPLAFGVLNQQSPARTAERWNPILHYVTSVSRRPAPAPHGADRRRTPTR